MNQKEAKRGQVLELLIDSQISQIEAAKQMGVSTRQARRMLRRYRASGLAGLTSKKRGRIPNNRIAPTVLAQALALIGTHYADFGPTLACEKLAERHAITLSVETVRKSMTAAGYWKPARGSKISVHPMRERRARFGEMIQIDGSPHDWFEGRGARCTLLVFIDDATSKLTQLRSSRPRPPWAICAYCTTTLCCTACWWRCTATDTASFASTPATQMWTPKPNSPAPHGSWGSNASTPTAHKPRDGYTASVGQIVAPPPEGASYLGFIFARAPLAHQVEHALRQAHAQLVFDIQPDIPLNRTRENTSAARL